MEIKKHDNGWTFVNEKGETVNLTWYEFWEICRHGRMIDAISEVEEYIEDCEEIAGMNANEILSNKELIEEIADEVINIRIGYESGDDIWDVANRIIKNGGHI